MPFRRCWKDMRRWREREQDGSQLVHDFVQRDEDTVSAIMPGKGTERSEGGTRE